jgi:hypothetical protein
MIRPRYGPGVVLLVVITLMTPTPWTSSRSLARRLRVLPLLFPLLFVLWHHSKHDTDELPAVRRRPVAVLFSCSGYRSLCCPLPGLLRPRSAAFQPEPEETWNTVRYAGVDSFIGKEVV